MGGGGSRTAATNPRSSPSAVGEGEGKGEGEGEGEGGSMSGGRAGLSLRAQVQSANSLTFQGAEHEKHKPWPMQAKKSLSYGITDYGL